MIINEENKDYEEFARKLFEKKKVLSFDYLNEYFYGIKRNYSNFDNIHLLLAFNNDYYDTVDTGDFLFFDINSDIFSIVGYLNNVVKHSF